MPCWRQAPRIVVPGRDGHRLAVDRQLDRRRRLDGGRVRRPRRAGRRRAGVGQRLGGAGGGVPRAGRAWRRVVAHSATSSGCRSADSIADDAVWPRPQIDASRIAWPISRSRASSSSRGRTRRARRQPREQLLLADAPDPARHALAARLVAEELGDPPERVDEVDGLVEDHDHARAERRPGGPRRLEGQRHVERVRPDEDARRAAEQDRPDRAARPATPPASSIRSRSVAPNSTS